MSLTCDVVEASLVHFPGKKFQTYDCVDNDDEDDKKSDV